MLVCEHASAFIPESMGNLGLSDAAAQSHAAWDPGAMAVAQRLSQSLNAVLVAATVSRLVYDCNRPPDAEGAMPARSEVIDVPGNVGLSEAERARRVARYYLPFRDALAQVVARHADPVIVTIHSFTPVYHGLPRATEIGVLHDTDTRLADAMLDIAPAHLPYRVEVNQPYGPQDGVTHTLKEHALPGGHLNVMLEIRNDLIRSAREQDKMAGLIAPWLVSALRKATHAGAATCTG